jgi:flavin reductase (DIM6/NTAB) family NADH-FMN oxidoreductase RutF
MNMETKQWYRVLAPRATVVVSTVDGNGVPNAAPFSFCMPVSIDPPIVSFASAPNRHTLSNIRETGEFIMNLPGKEMLSALWVCAKPFPAGVNEIEKAGLTAVKAKKVKVPRIGEAFGWIECVFEREIEAGDHFIVLGKVVCCEAKDGLLTDTGSLNLKAINPVLHIGGDEFGLATEIIKP